MTLQTVTLQKAKHHLSGSQEFKSEGHAHHAEVTMLTTAVVPLRLRSIAVLPSSESAKLNALFSACTREEKVS